MHIIVERMHHTLLGGIAYRSCRQFCSPPCWVVRGLQLKLHGTGHLIIPPHVPQLPPHYNEWNENEDMVAFHLEAIHQQVCAAETPAACKGTDTLEGGCAVLGVGVCVKRRACQPLHHAAVWRTSPHVPPSPCPCLLFLIAPQLQQAYVGMALAVASNRSFILPPVRNGVVERDEAMR